MCSRLREGICSKRLTLRELGEHSIDLQVIDEAGNIASENVMVNIEED